MHLEYTYDGFRLWSMTAAQVVTAGSSLGRFGDNSATLRVLKPLFELVQDAAESARKADAARRASTARESGLAVG